MSDPPVAGVRGGILIAEDEDGVRDSLTQVLREEGYDVVATTDGETAIGAPMILGDGDWITIGDLPRALRADADLPLPASDNLREALRACEKAHIQSVLARLDNDKRTAAEQLGMSLSSLYRKIEELGIGLTENEPPRAD